MRGLYAAVLILLAGCGVTEPTYVDIPAEQIEAIAQQWNVEIADLFLTHRNRLKQELSAELGMRVQEVIEDADFNGQIDALEADILTTLAKIEPASEAAINAAGDEIAQDPKNPANWIGAGMTAAGILLAGALGIRGRKKRKAATDGG